MIYEFARTAQATSPVVARWDEYMKDILAFDLDENGKPLDYACVFVLD